MPPTLKWVLVPFVVLLSLMVIAAVLLVLFQDRLVYYPDPVIHRTPQSAGLGYDDVRFETSNGVLLNGWYVPAKGARALVIVCHGNAGNISTRVPLLAALHSERLSSFIFDYDGFGRSGGRPTERGTHIDAVAAWQWVMMNVPMAAAGRLPIVVMGRSLGGPVAAYLASRHRPAALILDSTFPSLRSLVNERAPYLPAQLLLRYRYNTLAFLKRVDCPVLVVHSRDDRIIPISEGRKLYAAIESPKEFLEIGGPHVSGFVSDPQEYGAALSRFLDTYLPTGTRSAGHRHPS